MPAPLLIDEPTVDARRNANWARLFQKVYEVDPLECPNCGHTMRILDDADVVKRILKHLKVWNPLPDSAGRDPPWPQAPTKTVRGGRV